MYVRTRTIHIHMHYPCDEKKNRKEKERKKRNATETKINGGRIWSASSSFCMNSQNILTTAFTKLLVWKTKDNILFKTGMDNFHVELHSSHVSPIFRPISICAFLSISLMHASASRRTRRGGGGGWLGAAPAAARLYKFSSRYYRGGGGPGGSNIQAKPFDFRASARRQICGFAPQRASLDLH